MDIGKVWDSYYRNIIKVFFSSLLVVLPIWLIVGFLYRENSLLSEIAIIFIRALFYENLYRLIYLATKGELKWFNAPVSKNTLKVFGVFLLLTFLQATIISNILIFLFSSFDFIVIIALILDFLIAFFTFIVYGAFIFYSKSEGEIGLKEAIEGSIRLTDDYLLFIILAGLFFAISPYIPLVGVFINLIGLSFIEFIRFNLASDDFEEYEENDGYSYEDYGSFY